MLQFNRARSSGRAAHVGGVAMPAGASVIYYMDQATTQANGLTYLPNAAAPTTASLNLTFAPRRQFNNNNYWSLNGGTMTEGILGPDGLNEATEFSIAPAGGNWQIFPSQFHNAVIPAGTYTIAVNAIKLGTGASTIQIGEINGGQMTTVTITGSWQRFSRQFTSNGSSSVWPLIYNTDGGSAGVDMGICDFNIYKGSSDLGASGSGDANLYLGSYVAYGASGPYAPSGNLLNLSVSTGIGAFALPSAQTLGAVTVIAVSKKAATSGNTDSYNPLFAYATTGAAQWRQFCYNMSGATQTDPLYVAGGSIPSFTNGSFNNFVDQADNKLSFHAHVVNGSTAQIYSGSAIQAELAMSGTASSTSKVVQDLTLGRLQGSFLSNEQLYAFAIYPSALTQAQVTAAFAALSARATTAGLTIPTRYILVAEGDSITAQGQYLSYQSNTATTAPIVSNMYAVSGSKVANLATRASALDAALPASKSGRTYVLSIFIGTNDLNGTAGELTTYISDLTSYVAARRAAGWDKIIVGTVMDKTFAVTDATQRYNDVISANSTIRGWVGTTIDACADYAADAVMAPTTGGTNAANTTYFSSGLHPTDAGHRLMGPRLATAFNTL